MLYLCHQKGRYNGNAKKVAERYSVFQGNERGGYVYVDKTDLVWNVAHGDKFNYLSRPRRFGKSMLLDTLRCYFEGRKELFEGLRIMELEKDWTKHPVIRLDMSVAGATASALNSYLDDAFMDYEKKYDIKISPLQHSWHTPEHESCTAIYREVFAVLKTCTEYERFVFITGITKFTQISLFSVLNNLSNISFIPEYAAICGITVQETIDNFKPEIERLAEKNNLTFNGAIDLLKANYDGYHFSRRNMVDVFNPFNLINSLALSEIGNYWVMSGATSMLPKFVNDMELKLREFENCYVDKVMLESSDVTDGGAELFLYQSGYLTIKDIYEGGYILTIPNHEIRMALYMVVIPALTMNSLSTVASAQSKLLYQLNYCILDETMNTLKALISDVPYSNKKLASMDMEV